MTPSVIVVQESLAAFLAREGRALGLSGGGYELAYVSNPGGFVNANFTVRSGSESWHCKLARGEALEGLKTWWKLREPLSRRYHAPRMIAWIQLDDPHAHEGAILRHVPGRRAAYGRVPHVWASVGACLDVLHGDRALAEELQTVGAARSCLDYLEETYLDMVTADVVETRAHEASPPFVDGRFWEWALIEVERIRDSARASGAFDVAADSVVHGDLWEGNVLVDDDRWWIVDWDDIALGDRAKDLVDWWWGTGSVPPAPSEGVAERLPVWWRARTLVDAVDPLADWAEAVAAPEGLREDLRSMWLRVHQKGLARYRAGYR